MKKKQVLLAVFAATMLTPTVAWAQYPQISGEAKENYTKMMTEERKRSDEAWAKEKGYLCKVSSLLTRR